MTAKAKKPTLEEAKKTGLKNYANMVIQAYPEINARDAVLIKTFENSIKINQLALEEFQDKMQQLEKEKESIVDDYELEQIKRALVDLVHEISTREDIINKAKHQIVTLQDSIKIREQEISREKKVLEELEA